MAEHVGSHHDACGEHLRIQRTNLIDGRQFEADVKIVRPLDRFAAKPGTRVLVALSERDELVGGVGYFSDMTQYGSGGSATGIKQAAGIRLLGVDPACRNMGAGNALTLACLELARECGHPQATLHTTRAMQLAWGMYEKLGFVRAEDLDFSRQGLQVYGFRLALQ